MHLDVARQRNRAGAAQQQHEKDVSEHDGTILVGPAGRMATARHYNVDAAPPQKVAARQPCCPAT